MTDKPESETTAGLSVEPCTHPREKVVYTGDGTPVNWCPDCHSNRLTGGSLLNAMHAPAQATIAAQAAEIERLKRERDEAVGVLHRDGFVRCDIAACNCGSWHARFGWPERFREFTEALVEHGANLYAGKTALSILKEQLSELDALRAKQTAEVDEVMRLAQQYRAANYAERDAAREALRSHLAKDRT